MLYLLLLHTDPAHWAATTEAEMAAVLRAHGDLIVELRKSGKYQSSNALALTGARTVRVSAGKTLVTDGPFAETREQLGGYYLVDAKDLDEATSIAARIPDAAVGCVEIRPVKHVDL